MMEQNEHIERINKATDDAIQAILASLTTSLNKSIAETVQQVTSHIEAETKRLSDKPSCTRQHLYRSL